MDGKSVALGVAIGVGGVLLLAALSKLLIPMVLIALALLAFFLWRGDDSKSSRP